MKRIIKIGNTRYEVETEDDLIFLVHLLAREGFTTSEIAYILSIPKEKVLEYLEDCW